MALTYDLRDIPFLSRAERITDEEDIAMLRRSGMPGFFARDWYDLGPDNKSGVEPGVYVQTITCNALIWATMAIGIHAITEKNWKDFYARLAAEEKLFGARRRTGDGEPLFFTADEVKAHIGLHTNASRMTDAQWRKRLLENFVRDTIRNIED